jgi:FtsZ-binding cell division protein ZapB
LGVEKSVLETTLSSVREQVGNTQEERKRLQSDVEALRPEHAKLTSEVASMRQERADAEARMESLKEQLRVFEETYKGTLGQLDKQWGDSLAQWKSSQNETREMVERHWEELKNHIQNAVDIINGTWNKMKPPSAAESEEKYKDLWEPVLVEQFSDAHTASARDERQMLADLQASLRASGLSYHERDIYAFHTCLKTNDISPLTVLAGISGTGKSLLPQRYAAGMGMHYLPIPVQPRWDSPQDLFGFYNYVEQRYKAEPLARALVQMDQHTRFPDDVESLKGRMLLVLLDEMNLARVEYYFSEFLSKLETRRTINSKTEDGRAPASITFDMGALREGDTRYSTYPGSNVLFTGTMNEDETTQSLSDKVLDRANVLRFGRPLSLADKLKQEDLKDSADTSLSHAHWQRWIKEPDGTDMDSIRQDISSLNEAMARVRKPFGHRVNQAIQAYVANYPTTDRQGRNYAFADQIEQRIIPKLRGLDTQEREVRMALEEIGKVINGLEDAELSAEFESSRSGETFVWHGIDRNQGA